MNYDDLGNLTYKSDVGNYYYESSQPHAVSRITNPNSVITSYTQAIDYTGFDKVSLIRELDHLNGDAELASLAFTYGTSLERKITTTKMAGVETLKKLFIGGIYEEEIPASGDTRKLHYIMAGGEAIAIYTEEGASAAVNYLLKDHLGSVAAIADESGAIIERLSYNAWGLRRDAETWDDLSGSVNITFDRGFTGHEHLGLFALVNMNGRVYDPHTGRFPSADPYTQFPDFTQSLNRYSYVLNNPLSFTDPSGYLTVGTQIKIMQWGFRIGGAVIGGPIGLFFSSFVATYFDATVQGAPPNAAFKAAVKSTAYSTASALLSYGVGEGFGATGGFGKEFSRSVGHGLTQGALKGLTGGNFWQGFASGALGSASSSLTASSTYHEGLLIAMTFGGAGNLATGGNFEDGMMTGAMVYLFNHKKHPDPDRMIKEHLKKMKKKLNKMIQSESSPHWLETAEKELGVTEIEGLRNSLRVLRSLNSTDTGEPMKDETAWCGAFCNWVLMKSKVVSLEHAQAWSLAYKEYGFLSNDPILGSIAIIDYGNDKGHVGFVAGFNSNGDIILLGGNQGQQVKLSSYPSELISGYAYPFVYRPNFSNLPMIFNLGSSTTR